MLLRSSGVKGTFLIRTDGIRRCDFETRGLGRAADWINKTITKKRIRHGSVISLYSEIHEDNDLIPFILETKDDPRV